MAGKTNDQDDTLSGCLGLIAFLIALSVIAWILHAYDAIHLPRVSEGLFWGGYATYTAVMLFEITLLDKFSVIKSSKGWLYAVLAGIAFTAVPLLFLAQTKHVQAYSCGSWISPTPFALLTDIPFPNVCNPAMYAASRDAITVGVAGLAWPLFLMAKQVYSENHSEK
jgi:hypothetical protein